MCHNVDCRYIDAVWIGCMRMPKGVTDGERIQNFCAEHFIGQSMHADKFYLYKFSLRTGNVFCTELVVKNLDGTMEAFFLFLF